MKTCFLRLTFALAVLAVGGCQPDAPQVSQCQPPRSMVAQGPCESGYPGALLIASDYSTDDANQFLFEIFPQKDTLSNDLSVRAYKNGANTRERFPVSADVLQNAPKFIAQVSFICQGKERKSSYFAFVKRAGNNPGCYVWTQQKI